MDDLCLAFKDTGIEPNIDDLIDNFSMINTRNAKDEYDYAVMLYNELKNSPTELTVQNIKNVVRNYLINIDFNTSIRKTPDIALKMKIARTKELAVAISLDMGNFFRNANEMFKLIIYIVESTDGHVKGRYFRN